jgi:uncharacterized protein with NRDE domain
MCILFISIKQHKEYPLIILANRDEFHERQTIVANFWKEHPSLFAGKDLQEGGTWLGVAKNARISALTNHRNISLHKEGRISRGHLVRDYLTSNKNPNEYLEYLTKSKDNYNPYNILIGDLESLYVYNNVSNQIDKLENGFHGLSNAYLNSPWAKLNRGIAKLKSYILTGKMNTEDLFSIMKDETKAPDNLLPDTGVGIEKERFLSSIFINSPVYGTRSTAILLFDNKNKIHFSERTYDPKGYVTNELKETVGIEL